ncbi:hypothetical protein A3A39_04470 [Candidatus Kaiserbacteria bacterium RIFCSPLOWO2_01_FULL_54_13]|uniref:Uncharacterized protein n=1 Tax=Candidatus Kaiserbacteria bacterium RIFCSPLOWO2_01_FULL_54_13 TaxID=1798512 RepID=A0A1F6F1N0_9BACT|nr:MAG: hypothetical protein A3A39_04470 [Candidatus Kaiserbacteria bacterium RIFCSPLOWO2_01_FULL_54_13]
MAHYLSLQFISWGALAVAIALWAGVGFFAWTIAKEESAHASRAAEEVEESVLQSAILRLHALARETKDARARLEGIARRDVVEILDSIEGVARDSGVPIKIGQALAASSDPSSPLRMASFVIEAEGTFAQVAHVASLLESFPMPSSVNELQFEQLPGSTGAKKSKGNIWRVVARMRFFTTVDFPT